MEGNGTRDTGSGTGAAARTCDSCGCDVVPEHGVVMRGALTGDGYREEVWHPGCPPPPPAPADRPAADAEHQARYEVEYLVGEIIGPTEPGQAGFYEMARVQGALDDYRAAIEARARAEARAGTNPAMTLHETFPAALRDPVVGLRIVGMWIEQDVDYMCGHEGAEEKCPDEDYCSLAIEPDAMAEALHEYAELLSRKRAADARAGTPDALSEEWRTVVTGDGRSYAYFARDREHAEKMARFYVGRGVTTEAQRRVISEWAAPAPAPVEEGRP